MSLNTPVVVAVILVFTLLVEEGLLYLTLPMLKENGAVRPNYRGDLIPVAAGITFPLTVMLGYTLLVLLKAAEPELLLIYLVAVFGMSFTGFIDDMLGQRDTLGFKGHFTRLLIKGELTTGGLKALAGGFLALFVSLLCSGSLVELLLNTLLIALFTNSMNLFDLRPGRCIKVFLIIMMPVLIFTRSTILPLVPLLGAVLAYFRYDLKAQAMMGDAGSNVLGVGLGLAVALGLQTVPRLVILVLLVVLHLYAERYSITHTIEKYRILNAIDRIGRSD